MPAQCTVHINRASFNVDPFCIPIVWGVSGVAVVFFRCDGNKRTRTYKIAPKAL